MREVSPRDSSVSGTLRAGVAMADITPPLEVGLLMSSVESRWAPFQSVRLPLKARALVLESGNERVALVALDLLALNGTVVGGWTPFKRALSLAVSHWVAPERIVLICTHTHTAPESGAITNLYREASFRGWLAQVRSALACAIREAADNVESCSVAVASSELRGFSLQRRIPTPSGIKMSDSLQPIPPAWLDREPVDHRVHGLWFRRWNGSGIATVGHAACHPVHEMCIPQVSSDFPGEFCAALKAASDCGLPLFFNGAAGDINPSTVSGGADTASRHGRALAEVLSAAAPQARMLVPRPFAFARRTASLPMRSMKGTAVRRGCRACLSGLRLGSLAMLFLPGEIFVETARAIERVSPFEHTLIGGFAESTIGYVPTPLAFREGGYEIGPGKWSFLQPEAEPLLRKEAVALLENLWSAELENPLPVERASGGRMVPAAF